MSKCLAIQQECPALCASTARDIRLVRQSFPRAARITIPIRAVRESNNRGLTLQDAQTVVGRFDPAKSFGNSAFGQLRFRPVDGRSVNGDWETLATLVREPSLKELDCPDDAAQPCILKGTNLFLLDAVAADPQFSVAALVPEGFIGATLTVPHPLSGTLYVKLRDDPSDVNTASLPVVTSDQTPPSRPMPAPSPPQTSGLSGPN